MRAGPRPIAIYPTVRPPALISRVGRASVPWEMVRAGCACGTDIVAANNPGMIQAAVMAHQRTRAHRAWRKRLGL